MRRWSSVVTAIAFSCVFARFAMAQVSSASGAPEPPAGSNVLGSVVNGNTTIVFEAANPSDIDSQQLRTWGEFADAHPRIASARASKPSLINDASYLNKHPEINGFFQAHPDVRDAMVENPGNFVAISPRPGE